MTKGLVAFVGLCLVSATSASADIVDAAAGGFAVKSSVAIAKPATDVYQAMVRIATWWGSEHTWSGNAANLTLDPRPGGCWCEKLPNGGVEHMRVVYADAGKALRMSGVLGPMQEMGLAGAMTLELAEAAGTTTVTMTYKVSGYVPGGLQPIATPVNGVLSEQLERLKRLIETGKPDAPK